MPVDPNPSKEKDRQESFIAEEELRKNQAAGAQRFALRPKTMIDDEDWLEILEAYRLKFERDLDEDGILIFSSNEAAMDFFKEQASKGLSFFCTRMGSDRQLTDYHHYSCGDGNLYSGSRAEITSQLEHALKTASETNKEKIQAGLDLFKSSLPTPKPNPAASAREALKKINHESEDQADLAQGHTSPSPFSTTPRPKGF